MSESKSAADSLREKIAALQFRIAEAERELEAARSRIKELEAVARSPAKEKPPDPVLG